MNGPITIQPGYRYRFVTSFGGHKYILMPTEMRQVLKREYNGKNQKLYDTLELPEFGNERLSRASIRRIFKNKRGVCGLSRGWTFELFEVPNVDGVQLRIGCQNFDETAVYVFKRWLGIA